MEVSLPQLPFGVKSREVAIIWPDRMQAWDKGGLQFKPIHYQILFGEKASKLPFDVTLIHFDAVQIIYHRVYNICICLNTLEKVQIDRNDNLKKSLKLTIGKSIRFQSQSNNRWIPPCSPWNKPLELQSGYEVDYPQTKKGLHIHVPLNHQHVQVPKMEVLKLIIILGVGFPL